MGFRDSLDRDQSAFLPGIHESGRSAGRGAVVRALEFARPTDVKRGARATRGLPIRGLRANLRACKPSANVSKKPVSDWA